ncbi:TPA: methionyl-tRNA formyltransferase [Candidatus Uhrbacteria bacterium]|nr:methionyl-tRNA formyltransferase [Candidatus Uhrbacteria bacterium]
MLSRAYNVKIIFFGTPQFSADFLQGLMNESEFEVVGVVCQPDEPLGRKKILTAPPTKQLALSHNIPVFQPTKLKDEAFIESLRQLNADAFVVVSYGRIIPQIVLDLPKLGVINVHPSLLPKYRGPSPMQSAIAAGETETGISIMKLDALMDHGPILAQTKLSITPQTTSESLMAEVVATGVPLLIETLKKFTLGEITPTEQDHASATICSLLSRADGIIDWSQPAEVIYAHVRGLNPWPGTSTHDLKIFSVKITAQELPPGQVLIQGNRLFIGTGSSALEIIEIQPTAGKRMPTAAFIAGHRELSGTSLL